MSLYLGDFAASSTLDFVFNTRTAAGAPVTFAGSPVLRIYRANSDAQITSGITLTVDFDGITGLHHVRVDTSGVSYTTGATFHVVVQAGTVGGQSVVGEHLACFSLENRSALRPTVAGRTVDVTLTGAAGIDWGNVENQSTTVALSGTTIASGLVTTVNPVAQDGSLSLVRGDDYLAADGRALDFTDASALWPTITGATITATFRDTYSGTRLLTATGAVTVGSGAGKSVRLELTSAQTKGFRPGAPGLRFDIEATLTNTHVVTLVRGTVTVLGDETIQT